MLPGGSATPRHDHGRDFVRPMAVELGGNTYYVEAHISRSGALEMMQRLVDTRLATREETAAE